MIQLEHVLPADIEKTSFSMIGEELKSKDIEIPEELSPVIYRVIHATADFSYAETLCFTGDPLKKAEEALRNGAHIVTDTSMAYAGINKKALRRLGGEAHCFMADEDVAAEARERQVTRASVCMEKALRLEGPLIFAVGNAPTALITLREAIDRGRRPELIIGVPVGFVNVVQAKELILETGVPSIINRGRKGGSNVAAAICNALLYRIGER